jgi:hypothetical protein
VWEIQLWTSENICHVNCTSANRNEGTGMTFRTTSKQTRELL